MIARLLTPSIRKLSLTFVSFSAMSSFSTFFWVYKKATMKMRGKANAMSSFQTSFSKEIQKRILFKMFHMFCLENDDVQREL